MYSVVEAVCCDVMLDWFQFCLCVNRDSCYCLTQFFQEDLEKQQLQVNSLTHMVVVVDDSSNESATADLEEQLAVLGERWSNVCKWTEQR